MANCPNCGAPIVADQCEYCGTVFRTLIKCSHDALKCHETVERLLASGIVTANEARELCGLNRMDTHIPEWRIPFTPAEAYSEGELVSYHGVVRRSLINRNVYPPIHDSVWETVEHI